MIREIPETLTWIAPHAVLKTVFLGFLDRVSDAFGHLLKMVEDEAPEAYRGLSRALESASDEAFMRMLLAPETTYRLLCCREPVTERAHFLTMALHAEAARAGNFSFGGFRSEAWTALGDLGFRADGTRIENPRLEEGLVFDVMSPYAAAVDLGGSSGTRPRQCFNPGALTCIVAKMNCALEGIRRTGAVFRDFAVRFNFVFIAQIDRDDAHLFTSGSTGQYVGRSFVTNPHVDRVRPADLAEAMIHEGIHALLYMEEQRNPWVLAQELYDPLLKRVISPWTGSPLGIRPFLQACFVWFGLLHFWSAALQARAFDPLVIHERMTLALRGFLAGPLEQHIEAVHDDLAPVIVDAIRAMQAHVTRSWPLACA